ncbi:hypothetical protein WA158_008349 [Blastocystis sp. Blastoise]
MPSFGFNPYQPVVNIHTTGVDIGNAQRYYSRDVMRVGGEQVDVDASLTPGEPGNKKVTKEEKEIQRLLEKQLSTKYDPNDKVLFDSNVHYEYDGGVFGGLQTLEEYKKSQLIIERSEELRASGLNDIQVEMKLKEEGYEMTPHLNEVFQSMYKKRKIDPHALKHTMEDIEENMLENEEKVEQYKRMKREKKNQIPLATRMEDTSQGSLLNLKKYKSLSIYNNDDLMENKSVHKEKQTKNVLLNELEEEFRPIQPSLKTIKHYTFGADYELRKEKEMNINKEVEKSTINNTNNINNINSEEDQTNKTIEKDEDNNNHNKTNNKKRSHPIESVDITNVSYTDINNDYIQNHRITLEQIKEIPSFKNYTEGEPSRILFIKNISLKTTIEELLSIFNRYQEKQSTPIDYKYMTKGKMKGQAFITFENVQIATEVLKTINGYINHEKPIIIQYGKMK